MSSTHGTGTSGCGMAAVGTAAVPATSGTSYRAAVPSGVSSGIYAVLEMRDGDKSNLRDKGILKALVNIIDIIAHKLLGMDVWEQPEIDRRLVETLDGTKNKWGWSEVSLWLCISKITGMPAEKFVMPPTLFPRDKWWELCKPLLGVSGVLDCADWSRQWYGGHDH